MEKLQLYCWKMSAAGTAVLTLGMLLLVRWVTGFDGLYGQDAYAYLAYAAELKAYWAGSSHPGNFFWPEAYPALGALLSYLTGSISFGLQLVSILATAATVYFSARTLALAKSGGLPAPWIAFILLGASPFLFRMALTCMSDALAVAAIAACLNQCYTYRERGGSWLALATVFSGSLAVFTRYAALLLIAPLLLFFLSQLLQKRHFKGLVFALMGGLPPLLLHLWLSNTALPSHHFLENWSFSHLFQSEFEMQDGLFQYGQINLVAVFKPFYHPGFLGMGLFLIFLGLLELKQKIGFWGTPLLAIPLYLIFLAGIPFQNDRFGLLVLPFLLLFYPANLPKRIGERFARYRFWLLLPVLVIQGILVHWALSQRLEDNERDRFISEAVCQRAPAIIYTFGVDGALRNRCPQLAVLNLWDRPLTQAEQGELILFNLDAFEEQWKGKTVMDNWDFLDANYNLAPVDSFSAGWTLYEIR